ncbi:MAG: ribonuclease HII [Verrucomicrobiota bacterium]
MPSLEFEAQLRSQEGVSLVAGVDEAGRGPLAGPVVAAAVVLPTDFESKSLDDSKKLTAKRREILYQEITTSSSISWSCAEATVEEIESLNILRATHLAMDRALQGLPFRPEMALIDGLAIKAFPWAHRGLVKGDSLSLSIAAASIIAKVTRDRQMVSLAKSFPEYGFERHKGYGTAFHLEALRKHGPCPHHRRSFQPVAQLSLPLEDQG